MVQKFDDCRTLVIPTGELQETRWSLDLAISALEREFGLKPGQSIDSLDDDRQAHIGRLRTLRMAVHEDY